MVTTGQHLTRLLCWRGWGQRLFPGGAARLTPTPTAPAAALVSFLALASVHCPALR